MKERGLASILIALLVVGLIGAGIGAYVISQSGEQSGQQLEGPTEEQQGSQQPEKQSIILSFHSGGESPLIYFSEQYAFALVVKIRNNKNQLVVLNELQAEVTLDGFSYSNDYLQSFLDEEAVNTIYLDPGESKMFLFEKTGAYSVEGGQTYNVSFTLGAKMTIGEKSTYISKTIETTDKANYFTQ